jgi:hypothetical protein
MRTEAIVLQHPAAVKRSIVVRRPSLGGGLLLAAAIIATGTLVTLAALFLVAVAAPLVAGLVAWAALRPRKRSGSPRLGARVRMWRRARALRLVVLPGAPQSTALRAVR